jgi:hypothetical protein
MTRKIDGLVPGRKGDQNRFAGIVTKIEEQKTLAKKPSKKRKRTSTA